MLHKLLGAPQNRLEARRRERADFDAVPGKVQADAACAVHGPEGGMEASRQGGHARAGHAQRGRQTDPAAPPACLPESLGLCLGTPGRSRLQQMGMARVPVLEDAGDILSADLQLGDHKATHVGPEPSGGPADQLRRRVLGGVPVPHLVRAFEEILPA